VRESGHANQSEGETAGEEGAGEASPKQGRALPPTGKYLGVLPLYPLPHNILSLFLGLALSP